MAAARPLRRSALLDRVAQGWAAGGSLSAAAQRSAYRSQSTTGVRVSGPDSTLLETLRRSGCHSLASQDWREIGVYHRGLDSWVVLAAGAGLPDTAVGNASADDVPVHPKTRASAPVHLSSTGPVLGSRALQLVNEARARGARCGSKAFGPAPPMSLSATLAGVASGHAIDMAEHNYFEHQDLSGKSPADRVRAVGYREKLVGENIAYGPDSVEEVVQGWLDSPGHCENMMNPRFAQMGIAYSPGRTPRRGLYWVQLLAEPRA
ncbi:MAG: CAP domain-containing protein [Steroidobacteraceae bacterium]